MKNNNTIPILYSFRRCPYAMRARLIILLSQIKVELREVKLSNKPEEMTTISKKGTDPVLLLPSNKIIDESLDVMNWALDINDPENIKNTIINYEKDTKHIIKKFDNDFKYHLDRYKYYTRYRDDHKLKTQGDHRDLALETLKIVEDILNSQNSWIFGNYPSFLDIAILPFVRQYRIADITWFDEEMPLRKTHRWLMQFLDWQTFIRSMQKYKIWESQDKPVYFGQ